VAQLRLGHIGLSPSDAAALRPGHDMLQESAYIRSNTWHGSIDTYEENN